MSKNNLQSSGHGVVTNDLGDIGGNLSFDQAMGNIAQQARAHELLEARAQRRQAMMDNLKKAAAFLFIAALLGAGYYYRNDLQSRVTALLNKQPQINGTTGAALKSLEAGAAKRDAMLDELTATKKATEKSDKALDTAMGK